MHIFGSRRGDIEEASALASALADPAAAIEMINKLVEAANLNKETTLETQSKIEELKAAQSAFDDKEAEITKRVADIEAEYEAKLLEVEKQKDVVLVQENEAKRLQGEHQRKIAALDSDNGLVSRLKDELATKERILSTKEDNLSKRDTDLKNREQALIDKEAKLASDQSVLDSKLAALRGLAS